MVSVQYPPKHRHVLYQSRILLYYILWIYKFNSFIGRLFPWYIFTVVDTVGCKLYYCPKQYKRHTHYIKNYFIVYIYREYIHYSHDVSYLRFVPLVPQGGATFWGQLQICMTSSKTTPERKSNNFYQFLKIIVGWFFLEISKLPPSRFYIEIYC